MIVQLRGVHLRLTDERYALVMDHLEDGLQALSDRGDRPLQVDVELEKTVQRAPQTRRGERMYRVEAEVLTPGGQIRVRETADDLRRAIAWMGRRLEEQGRLGPRRRTESTTHAAPRGDAVT
jgi:ribosome-associated translation inhibitor RaiA